MSASSQTLDSAGLSYLNIIGRVPVDIVKHQMGGTDQIKPHPPSFGAEQKNKVLRIRAVETVNQSLPLVGWCLSVQATEGVAREYAQVLEQIQRLGVVGHDDHPVEDTDTLLNVQNHKVKRQYCTPVYVYTVGI